MSTDAPTETLQDLVAQEQAAAAGVPADDTPPAHEPSTELPDDTPPEPTDDPTPPEPGDPEPTDPEPEPDENARVLREMEKSLGIRLSDRYTSPEEAWRGLREIVGLVGQRSEDAQFARSLHDKYGDRLGDMLAKLAESPAPDHPSSEDTPFPGSYEEYVAIQKTAMARSREPGYEADPDYRRGVDATQALAKRTFETIREFDAVKKELAEVRGQLTTQQEAHQTTTSERDEQAWWGGHEAEMCQGGEWDKLTPLAQRTIEIAKADEDCIALQESRGIRAALEVARVKALALQPKPKRTKPVSPQSVHQPGVAPSEHRALTVEEVEASDLQNEARLLGYQEAVSGAG